jgi:hypothetical protein
MATAQPKLAFRRLQASAVGTMITTAAKPSASPQGPTVDYRPTEGWAMRLPLPAGSGATATASQDLQGLLRRRLFFVALVFSAYAALVLGLMIRGQLLGGGTLIPGFVVWLAATAANLLVSLGLAGLLASRIRLSLRQLRGCELLLFGAGFGRYLLRQIVYLWPGSCFMGLVGGALEAGESLRTVGERENDFLPDLRTQPRSARNAKAVSTCECLGSRRSVWSTGSTLVNVP